MVECSGDPIHATYVLEKALEAGLPAVTMDSELQITTGSWLSRLVAILQKQKAISQEV